MRGLASALNMPELLLNDENFKNEVLDFKGLVLVDFLAEWCGPCKMMAPIIEELAKEYEGKPIKIGKLNIDQGTKTAEQYNVMSVPTFIFFKNGTVKEEMIGAIPKDSLKEKIEALMK